MGLPKKNILLSLSVLCILFFNVIASAQPQHNLYTAPFHIHYAAKDSLNAHLAKRILSKSFQEISFDLQAPIQDTIHVYIVPTRSAFRDIIQGSLPEWTGAFASPLEHAMYIKSPSWDVENDYQSTLIHELLHLILYEKMGLVRIPRWMNEGMAIFYSNDQRWITSTALSKALATRSVIPLADIDRVLNFHRIKAELAYQESYSAVRYLLAVYDIDALRTILDELKARNSLDQAFMHATGSTFTQYEKEWLQYAKKTYKWVWLHEFDQYIWTLILCLFILSVLMVRLRNRRKLHEWDLETELEQNISTDLPPDTDNPDESQ